MDLGDIKTQREVKRLEKRIHEIYSDAENDINNKLQDFNNKFSIKNSKHLNQVASGEWTQDDYDKWYAGQMFQERQWQAKKDQIITTMTNANSTAIDLVNNTKIDIFAHNANYQAYEIENGLGVDVGFGLYDAKSVSVLLKDDPQILPKWKIDEPKDYVWNAKKVNTAITQGIVQGERIDQITKRLTDSLVTSNEKKMELFARTGAAQAQNAGRYERLIEAKDMGIDVVKRWVATLDNRTRDSHRDLDGEEQEVGTDDEETEFSNGCRYPGDPLGPPEETYNCRCKLVGSLPKYEQDFNRYDQIEGKPIPYMTYSDWEATKQVKNATGINSFVPNARRFKADFDKAKATLPKGGEWRVDDTYTVEDYEHKKLFELDGGSVVAVTPQGDIVSVCKNLKGNDRGSDLLKIAIANGGDRLDAFGEDLYNFYTKNGFEAVSWTPFNEEYAPHDWVKGRDEPEEVVFYRYTGKKTNITYEEFITNTPPSTEYDEAKDIRDKLIDSLK